MTKLQRVFLVKVYEPECDDRALNTKVLVGGRSLTVGVAPGSELPTISLEDDCEHRRVWVRIPGRDDAFIPYEHIERATTFKLQSVPTKAVKR